MKELGSSGGALRVLRVSCKFYWCLVGICEGGLVGYKLFWHLGGACEGIHVVACKCASHLL